ncbi:MAG: dolichyl-phosphate beta-glucosyltransferase [Candidatus Latescibacterota bacterium]
MDLTLVVPAYNEEKRILLTLKRTVAFLSQRPWAHEVLVVDDGSGDGTAAAAERFSAGYPAVRCLRNPANRGKGYSVRHGVQQAAGQRIGFMDADYKTDIAALDTAMERLDQGADGAIGDRTLGGTRIAVARRRHRQVGSRLFRILLQHAMGLQEFGDTQCGFKFFQAPVARHLFARQRIDGFMFDVEILLLARRAGYRIDRIPVVWSDDPDSRFHPVRGGLRDLAELAQICWHLGR